MRRQENRNESLKAETKGRGISVYSAQVFARVKGIKEPHCKNMAKFGTEKMRMNTLTPHLPIELAICS